jgi:hypothetical protein
MARQNKTHDPFRWFDSSPEVRGPAVRARHRHLPRDGQALVEQIRPNVRQRDPQAGAQTMRHFTHWRWHLDEVYVRINGEMHYL